MIDFIDFDELDYNALGVGLLCAAFLGFFLISDPGNMGMSGIPILYRLISIVLCIPLGYIIWIKMVG